MLSAKLANQATVSEEEVTKRDAERMLEDLESAIQQQMYRGFYTYKTGIRERQTEKVLDIVLAELKKEGYAVEITDVQSSKAQYLEISWKNV